MLNKISLGIKEIGGYRTVVDKSLIDEVEALARDLRGLRLCHINSTPFGGGVAELLISIIPILRGLGISADWQVIRGDQRFFAITKSMHNAIQGGSGEMIKKESTRSVYQRNNLTNARELDKNYDVFIINDPQPAALRHYCEDSKAKWIWRCHVDSSQPNQDVWQFLRPYVEEYDAAVFTLQKFVPHDLNVPRIATMAPAIDPFSSKNMALPKTLCREMIGNLGLDKDRPLVTQISRFDPWKDPFGVIAAYKLAKREIPRLQLAMVGSFAGDDPEAWGIYAQVHEEANKDDDIFIFSLYKIMFSHETFFNKPHFFIYLYGRFIIWKNAQPNPIKI